MVSCQKLWKSVWKSMLTSCEFGVEKPVDIYKSLRLAHFISGKGTSFVQIFIGFMENFTSVGGKILQGGYLDKIT